MHFWRNLPFGSKIGKNWNRHNFWTAWDMTEIFCRVHIGVSTIKIYEFGQNLRGSLLEFADFVWFLENMSLKISNLIFLQLEWRWLGRWLERRKDGWRMVPRQIMVFVFRLCLLGIILVLPNLDFFLIFFWTFFFWSFFF